MEQCSGRVHDSALFIDEHGCALANYRRTHLLAGDEPEALAPGHWLNLVSFAGHRFGVLLGADIEAPEPARALALAGAAALLVPAAHGTAIVQVASAVLATRAFENGCGLAYAKGHGNAGGPESCIVGPDGRILAQAGDKLVVSDLPLTRPADAARRLAARRPQLYQKLAAPHPDGDGPRL